MLGFVTDEKVSIVHCFGQWAMRLPKLRKVEPCGGQDKLGMLDLLVFVGVTGIKIGALTCASLRVGKEPNQWAMLPRDPVAATLARRWP